jgi:hypothetical protein
VNCFELLNRFRDFWRDFNALNRWRFPGLPPCDLLRSLHCDLILLALICGSFTRSPVHANSTRQQDNQTEIQKKHARGNRYRSWRIWLEGVNGRATARGQLVTSTHKQQFLWMLVLRRDPDDLVMNFGSERMQAHGKVWFCWSGIRSTSVPLPVCP